MRPRHMMLLLAGLAFAVTPVHARETGAGTGVTVTRGTVRPGERQTVVAHVPAGKQVQIEVALPDGEKIESPSWTSGTSGTVSWSFIQPPGAITRTDRTATARVTMNGGTLATQYKIGFAPIDLVAPHGAIAENSQVTFWVHTHARTRVDLQVTISGVSSLSHMQTDAHGWANRQSRFTNDSAPFQPVAVTVTASASLGGHTYVARGDFSVKPFQFTVSLNGVTVLHSVGGQWVPTTSVHPGEAIRVTGSSFITEPAGNMPYCVDARVTLSVPGAPIRMAPLTCDPTNPGERTADLDVPGNAKPGAGQIVIDASFINGGAHVVVPITVVI